MVLVVSSYLIFEVTSSVPSNVNALPRADHPSSFVHASHSLLQPFNLYQALSR